MKNVGKSYSVDGEQIEGSVGVTSRKFYIHRLFGNPCMLLVPEEKLREFYTELGFVLKIFDADSGELLEIHEEE